MYVAFLCVHHFELDPRCIPFFLSFFLHPNHLVTPESLITTATYLTHTPPPHHSSHLFPNPVPVDDDNNDDETFSTNTLRGKFLW